MVLSVVICVLLYVALCVCGVIQGDMNDDIVFIRSVTSQGSYLNLGLSSNVGNNKGAQAHF